MTAIQTFPVIPGIGRSNSHLNIVVDVLDIMAVWFQEYHDEFFTKKKLPIKSKITYLQQINQS